VAEVVSEPARAASDVRTVVVDATVLVSFFLDRNPKQRDAAKISPP
jgi:hypothetical protein